MTFFSCKTKNVSYYEFQNIHITRVDFPNKSIFYFGKCGCIEPKCDSSISFSIEYNFRGGIDIYLILRPRDNKVEIIDHGLGLLKINDTSKFYKLNIKNSYYKEEVKKLFLNEEIGIIRISNNQQMEEEWQKEKNGRVLHTKCQ